MTTLKNLTHPGIASALLAALLFGASTPLAKWLLIEIAPLMLASLLYLGSGIALLGGWWLRRRFSTGPHVAALQAGDLPWLSGAIVLGGILGPWLLMQGLARTPASSASLLLNLEGVFTALLAYVLFREHIGRRIALGMGLIVAGSLALSWRGMPQLAETIGPLTIIVACLCWALDNNFTRQIAAGDALFIAGSKGLIAGLVNLALALALGQQLPAPLLILGAAAVGAVGYGASLGLFIVALRHAGTARTGAYFSLAPFCGAALAVLLLHETPAASFWLAACFMGAGVWLHISERHAHTHSHEPLAHSHSHTHDEHHQHEHDFPVVGAAAHTHFHVHAPLCHSHPHYPDIHHRHSH